MPARRRPMRPFGIAPPVVALAVLIQPRYIQAYLGVEFALPWLSRHSGDEGGD